MKPRLTKLLISLIAFASLSTNYVQAEKLQWSTGIGTGALFFEGDEEFNSSWVLDTKLGYEINPRYTVEAGIGWLPYVVANDHTSNDPNAWHLDKTSAFRASLDILYHLRDKAAEEKKIDTFLAATSGAMYYSNSLRDDGHFESFVGAGFGAEYPMNKRWSARGDYRLLVEPEDGEINHLTLLTLVRRWGCGCSDGDHSHGSLNGDDLSERAKANDLQTIYFDFDKSIITAEAQDKLRKNAQWLKENPHRTITLEGHCDERGTNEYNFALGERRANAAKKYLISLGVDSSRLNTLSYGEERPANPASNRVAWAENRRVECVPK